MVEFTEFDKISRLNREVIVTEKIDGTNGQVHIRQLAEMEPLEPGYDTQIDMVGDLAVFFRHCSLVQFAARMCQAMEETK